MDGGHHKELGQPHRLHRDRRAKLRFQSAMEAFQRGEHARAARGFAAIAGKQTVYALLARYYAAESHLRAGLRLLRRGEAEQAAREFTAAQQHNPEHGDLPRFLACALATLGRYDQAGHVAAREAERHPASSDSRIRVALCHWLGGQRERALEVLREGLLRQPGMVEWHFQLGLLLAAREHYREAIESLHNAVTLDPLHAAAHLHLGLCHGALQQTAAAIRHLCCAQRQRPHDPRVALLLTTALRAHSGSADAALDLAAPSDPPVLQLADLEQFARLVEHEPDVIEAFVSGAAAASGDLFSTLEGVVRRALGRHPQRAELYLHQARLHRRLGHGPAALEACAHALRLVPACAPALVMMGELHLEAGHDPQAARCFEKVLALGCDYADVHFRLGCIYRDRGDHARARGCFVAALRINSGYIAARQALECLAA